MNKFILLIMCSLLSFGTANAQLQLFAKAAKSKSIVSIGSHSYYVHTVAAGETLSSLARTYEVPKQEIINNNPQTIDGLQVGQVLKIPYIKEELSRRAQKAQSKLFDQHTVNAGETAYSIAKRYGVSVNTLIEDNNGVDITTLCIGQILNIRKSEMGDSNDTQIKSQLETYKDKLNSVSTDFQYHLVAKGETIYSLSKQFNVSQAVLTEINGLKEGLKLGAMIKIPTSKSAQTSQASLPSQTDATQTTETLRGSSADSVKYAENISIKTYQNSKPLNVAMLLPLKASGSINRNFMEFYQGALMAMEDLKAQGVSVELNLYNTERSVQKSREITGDRAFEQTDLIIGPVYEESLEPVLDFARKHRVAVVSPLANIEQQHSQLLYQLSPQVATKYNKMHNVLSPNKNIVVIGGAGNDTEFEREITAQLPLGYHKFTYSRGIAASAIEALISGEKDNVFVILSSNEYHVDEILARISSVQNNLLARSIKNANITIVGSSRWNRFVNIDKNLFFKLGLCFITSYHADRSEERVANFDKRYIAAYGSLPTLYSYRGYDATKLFVDALLQEGSDFTYKINQSTTQLLQMKYHFVQSQRGENNVNDQWGLVTYMPDYTVVVR